MNKIRQLYPEIDRQVHFVHQSIGLRNRLTHGYDVISNEMVWDIAGKKLPLLVEEVKSLLESLDGMALEEDEP